MAYLDDHPPRRSQFRRGRRAPLRGVIVVHTAESVMDGVGPDTGAENVARWIQQRTDAPGSYHDVVDSDSYVNVVGYDNEAFQDGTGSNPWAMGLSFAVRTTDWNRMTAEKRAAFIDQGARRAAAMARHIKARTGKVVAARRITRTDSERGVTGFVAHGDRDPGRRTDPGTAPPNLFPWDEFLARYRHHATDLLGGTPVTPPPTKDWFDMATEADLRKIVRDETNAVVLTRLQPMMDLVVDIAGDVQELVEETIGVVDKDGQSRQDRFAKRLDQVRRAQTEIQADLDALSVQTG